MATNDIAIRFTEETYATKAQVSRALNTSLVDNFWQNILAYRAQFARLLPLRTIDKKPFTITLSPAIAAKVATVERKLTKGMLKYSLATSKDDFRKSAWQNCLLAIAKTRQLPVNDQIIRQMLGGNALNLGKDQQILDNYLNALKSIEQLTTQNFDEDFVANLFSKLSGNDEMIALYRTADRSSPFKTGLVNRLYEEAPAAVIADMMQQLYAFLAHSELGFFTKAIVAFFYVLYLQPFDSFNEEFAVLCLKAILVKNEIGEFAGIIPFEELIAENKNIFADIKHEVQRSDDITYLLVYACAHVDKLVDRTLDEMVSMNVQEVKKEFYRPEVEAEDRADIAQKTEVLSKESDHLVSYEMKVAIPTLPIGFDEKDALKIEEHLLEINPSLKRGEAYFYARHCTIGKYYTISQYKKGLGCAYETARTSMDHLANEGYYRKEKIKNKFIYTPIARGDK